MSVPQRILLETLALSPTGKLELVDCLLASLDAPDKEIDQLLMEEVERRNDAYDRGTMRAVKLNDALLHGKTML